MAGPKAKTTKPRRSAGRRHLVRWNDDLDIQLLLGIQSECNVHQIALPWDSIAESLGIGATGGAVIQHLAKTRNRRIVRGLAVPPPLRRGGGNTRNVIASAPEGTKSGNNISSKTSALYRVPPSKAKSSSRSRRAKENDDDGESHDLDNDPDGDYGAPSIPRSGRLSRRTIIKEEVEDESDMVVDEAKSDTRSITNSESTGSKTSSGLIGVGASFLQLEDDPAPGRQLGGKRLPNHGRNSALVVRLPITYDDAQSRSLCCNKEHFDSDAEDDGSVQMIKKEEKEEEDLESVIESEQSASEDTNMATDATREIGDTNHRALLASPHDHNVINASNTQDQIHMMSHNPATDQFQSHGAIYGLGDASLDSPPGIPGIDCYGLPQHTGPGLQGSMVRYTGLPGFDTYNMYPGYQSQLSPLTHFQASAQSPALDASAHPVVYGFGTSFGTVHSDPLMHSYNGHFPNSNFLRQPIRPTMPTDLTDSFPSTTTTNTNSEKAERDHMLEKDTLHNFMDLH